MKKGLLFLLPLLLGACSAKEESPVIKVEELYISLDGEEGIIEKSENYAGKLDQMPALEPGDKVDAYLSLDGNGAELKAFRLLNDGEVLTDLIYEEGEVTSEGNLTNKEKGQLRFKDGITRTKILVQAAVEKVDKNGDVKLSFYLSSKAECEGAQAVIDLKTKVADDESLPK